MINNSIKERYENARTWQDRALIIQFFHIYMSNREERWSLRQTASYFKISLGLVSEDLKLARNMEIGIRKFELRKDALKFLKSLDNNDGN